MSESASQAAKGLRSMDDEERRQNLVEVAGPSNEIEAADPSTDSSALRFLDLPEDCMIELFEYLSLKDLHSLGQTCKLMQKWGGRYFKLHFKTAQKFTEDNGIHTVYSDHEGVTNARTQTSGFNRYITYTSHYYGNIGPMRYLKRFTDKFESLKDLYLVCVQINSRNIECLKDLMGKLESVCLHQCSSWKDFHDTFLQFCPKLKHLRLLDELGGILSGEESPWMLNQYPNLESVHFEPRHAKHVIELRGFLENNPNIRNFGTLSKFFYVNAHMLFDSEIKLDELYIRQWNKRDGDTFMDDMQQLCQLLNELHDQGFHKRLHFHTDRFNQEYSEQLISLRGLERLTIDRLDGIFGLPAMVNLRELSLPGDLSNKDIEALATSLENLEQLNSGQMNRAGISTIISRLPGLRKFHVHPAEGTLNLVPLNEQREKVVGACKVMIFVSQQVYMATKWRLNYGDISEMRRNTADALKNRFLN